MNFQKFCKKIIFFAFFPLAVCFFSCKTNSAKNLENNDEIFIGNKFFYWISDENSTVKDAENHYSDFKKLNDNTTKNLEKTLLHDLGENKNFVWVRAEFSIPESLKGKMLGLVIPYLRMSEVAYLNGNFIGSNGSFPPNEKSALYKTHYYALPAEIINQESTNVLLIKVWSHGQSAISSKSFIKEEEKAKYEASISNFWNTRIYIFFEGGVLFAFILYFLLAIKRNQSKENFDFAVLNFFTLFISIPFFAPEIPWYFASFVSFPTFMKFTISLPFYWIFYFITSFIMDFEHSNKIEFVEKIRLGIVLGQTLITLIIPNYDILIDITKTMIMFSLLQLCFGLYAFVRNLFIKKRRHDAIIQFFGFLPVIISICLDFGLRLYDNTRIFPFFTIFGWQFSLIEFIIIHSLRYSFVYNQNEQFKNNLQKEVELRTIELKDTNLKLTKVNEQLEKDRILSEMDLSTASLVQKKFFPQPENSFIGWELAVCYEPLSKVSGDLYDYYTYGNTLNGISIFDVSGHGISAALITMLARSIISHSFQKGFKEHRSLSAMLKEINEIIIGEKGEIDNYLTGLICRFDNFYPDGSIHVELGNAGHPYPILYSAKNKKVLPLIADNNQFHFGAIGMQGINPKFAVMDFIMNVNDVFVCYSDGLTEATNKNNEQFGRKRLESCLLEVAEKSPKDIILSIKEKFNEFCGTTPRQDDITIIVLKRKKTSYIQLSETIEELPVL